MGPEDGSRTGKRKVRELRGPDGARRSIAVTSGAVSSEYGETQASARRTGVTSLNIEERARTLRLRSGQALGHRAVAQKTERSGTVRLCQDFLLCRS